MVIHGDAEYVFLFCRFKPSCSYPFLREISVYNHFASMGLGDTAQHNREEHASIKKMVYDVDTAALTDSDFDDIVTRAGTAFLDHAKEEEEKQFELIQKALSPEENDVRLFVNICAYMHHY